MSNPSSNLVVDAVRIFIRNRRAVTAKTISDAANMHERSILDQLEACMLDAERNSPAPETPVSQPLRKAAEEVSKAFTSYLADTGASPESQPYCYARIEICETALRSPEETSEPQRAYRAKDCICEHTYDLTIPGGHHNRACPLRSSMNGTVKS